MKLSQQIFHKKTIQKLDSSSQLVMEIICICFILWGGKKQFSIILFLRLHLVISVKKHSIFASRGSLALAKCCHLRRVEACQKPLIMGG